jgi:hypothetical protein
MRAKPILVACPQCHQTFEALPEIEQVTVSHYERQVTVKFMDVVVSNHDCNYPTTAGGPDA